MEVVILRIPDHEQEADDVEECCWWMCGLAIILTCVIPIPIPLPPS